MRSLQAVPNRKRWILIVVSQVWIPVSGSGCEVVTFISALLITFGSLGIVQ